METVENKGRQHEEEEALIRQRLSSIRNTVVVLSGKGGVGKSTVAAGIAFTLARSGYRTGLMDVDIHGPSIPKLLGLEGSRVMTFNNALVPVPCGENLSVLSIGFLMEDQDSPVIWRGPAKMGVIRQFIKDVEWGELDYLVVDCPPGTGDEPLSVIQTIGSVTGAVIVTTPQQLAIADVRKSVNFCKTLGVPVLGVIENMSGFVCPDCDKMIDIFKRGGGEKMAQEMNVPFLGRLPIDPQVVELGDSGGFGADSFDRTVTAGIMKDMVTALLKNGSAAEEKTARKENAVKRFAVPTARGELCMHFGHCEVFTFIEVNEQSKAITKVESLEPPEHEPGVIPRWVAQQRATIVIAGGMGARAQALFKDNGVEVIVGAAPDDPASLVLAYLNGTLKTGANACDH